MKAKVTSTLILMQVILLAPGCGTRNERRTTEWGLAPYAVAAGAVIIYGIAHAIISGTSSPAPYGEISPPAAHLTIDEAANARLAIEYLVPGMSEVEVLAKLGLAGKQDQFLTKVEADADGGSQHTYLLYPERYIRAIYDSNGRLITADIVGYGWSQ